MGSTSVLIAGVGGQGILLASSVLALAAQHTGVDVKMSEVHGMAQRGGSVTCQVRFGEKIFSPLIPRSGADFLMAFEPLEAVRYLDFLKPGGTLMLNKQAIVPVTMLLKQRQYPPDIVRRLENMHQIKDLLIIDAVGLASNTGYPRTANVVMLGALARLLWFETSVWSKAMADRIPGKYLRVNEKAFRLGWNAVVEASPA